LALLAADAREDGGDGDGLAGVGLVRGAVAGAIAAARRAALAGRNSRSALAVRSAATV
jgi:hypothetical protein